jgi:hypothetical protein
MKLLSDEVNSGRWITFDSSTLDQDEFSCEPLVMCVFCRYSIKLCVVFPAIKMYQLYLRRERFPTYPHVYSGRALVLGERFLVGILGRAVNLDNITDSCGVYSVLSVSAFVVAVATAITV